MLVALNLRRVNRTIEYAGVTRAITFLSEISVWKNPSSVSCKWKLSPQFTTRMSTSSSTRFFSDISGYLLNLAITAWASCCSLSRRGQIYVTGMEGRSNVPFNAFRCDLVAYLESSSFIERVPIARSPCRQSHQKGQSRADDLTAYLFRVHME